MKIRKKNINFRFKKSKLKSKNEKSIMQRSLIIKNCYRELETHKLESHLYSMFNTREFEDSRPIAEELLGCINEYLYSPEELVMNIDFKRGMDELSFWCMRLIKRLEGRDNANSKVAVELLMPLINDINSCELKTNENLSRIGLAPKNLTENTLDYTRLFAARYSAI